MSSFRTLNIGMTALFAQKTALDTTGQNIANAATPGYARQRVNMEANRPQVYSYGAVGTGVDVRQIEHLTDEFLEAQVRTAVSDKGMLDVYQSGYSNIEVYFNELSDNDISSAFNNFWKSMQDWNNNVEDGSTRNNVLANAATLCDTFQSTRDKLYQYRYQTNNAVVDSVNSVNTMINEIADLNASIMKIEAAGATGVIANDLRDQRTQLAKELSKIMDVSVNEEKNGALVVAQKGRMLVYQDKAFELTTEKVQNNGMLIDKVVFAADHEEVRIESGKLYGQTQMRDEICLSFEEQIDQLAGEFIWEYNRIHSQGVGLTAYDSVTATNAVIDPTVTLDQLAYNFTPVDGTFEIKDGSFELKVFDSESGQATTVNIDINLTNVENDQKTILAETEPIEVSPGVWRVVQPETSLLGEIQKQLDSVAPNTFKVELDYSNQLKITSNADGVKIGFGRDTSGVLAALGINTVFNGYNAETMSVNKIISDNPEYLAGASEFVEGNQDNVKKLLDLRSAHVMANDTSTFEDFYESIIGSLGIEASRVNSLQRTQTDIVVRVENQREDLSGVNLDEEMTKMMQFQKSYQAAAKFITTADSMLDTLMNMVQ